MLLVRQPENPYDVNAIRVDNITHQQVTRLLLFFAPFFFPHFWQMSHSGFLLLFQTKGRPHRERRRCRFGSSSGSRPNSSRKYDTGKSRCSHCVQHHVGNARVLQWFLFVFASFASPRRQDSDCVCALRFFFRFSILRLSSHTMHTLVSFSTAPDIKRISDRLSRSYYLHFVPVSSSLFLSPSSYIVHSSPSVASVVQTLKKSVSNLSSSPSSNMYNRNTPSYSTSSASSSSLPSSSSSSYVQQPLPLIIQDVSMRELENDLVSFCFYLCFLCLHLCRNINRNNQKKRARFLRA